MYGKNLMKVIGITMIILTIALTGCGNEETTKTDTKKQPKSVEKKEKKVKIESNEGKPQHEQLITVNLPPRSDYIKGETTEVYEQDKNKYNNTKQLITNNSVTLLLGDYCYYDPVWDVLKCSVVIVNGTDTKIKDLSFQANVENKSIPEKTFLDGEVPEFTKSQIGNFQPNTAIPIVLSFPEKNPTDSDEEGRKIDSKGITIKIKNIQYKAVE